MKQKKSLFMVLLVLLLFIKPIHADAAVKVSSDSSNILVAEYSDDYFSKSATNQSNDLARLSLVASDAAYKDTNTFLKALGFQNVVTETLVSKESYVLHPIRVTMGNKTILANGEQYALYAILVRGTEGALEWLSDLDGPSLDKENAKQFVIPKNQIMNLFNQYSMNLFKPQYTKIWVTGHSRGGAVANLLAHELNEKYPSSNVYAYTFASAKVVKEKKEDANIFNYIIQEDVVPKVPPGYVRYGKDIVLDTKGEMETLYKRMTSKSYSGNIFQAHSLEAYMCALVNTFPKVDTKISIDTKSKTLYAGEKYSLKAIVTGEALSEVRWKTSNERVADVSMSGNVTAKKAGIATITAYVTGDDGKIKEATCRITVKNASIKLNKSSAIIYESGTGKTVQLKATVVGATKTVLWSTSDKKIATVNSNGKVVGKKVGTVTITAKANGKTANCKIQVKKKPLATSVISEVYYKDYKEYMIVKGLNSNKEAVWKYKTKEFTATELRSTKCITRKNMVYIFEGSAVTALRKGDGKKLWSLPGSHTLNGVSPAGHIWTFDKNDNLYVIGYYDTYCTKVTPKGKIAWKMYLLTTSYWPTEIKCTGDKIKIIFANDDNDPDGLYPHEMMLSQKNGKIFY